VGKLRAHVDEVIEWVACSLVYTSIALHESAVGTKCECRFVPLTTVLE
jgi:hypothetical protein